MSYQHRPIEAPISQTAPFVLHRVTKAGVSEIVTTAITVEQVHDLARSDRARLRDLRRIDTLERHEYVTRSTGNIRQIPIPR